MIGKIIGILIIFFQFVLLSEPVAADVNISRDPEYQKMLEGLNRRYEGFFIHQNDEKRWERRRRSGTEESKEVRENYKKQREWARKNFIRKPPPDMEPARLRWESEQQLIANQRELYRKNYVKKRSEIQRVKESARKIPANQEFDLQ